MSVFLIGGGWSDDHPSAVYGGFLAQCGVNPRIRLVVMGAEPEQLPYHERFVATLQAVGAQQLLITPVPLGSPCPEDVLDGVDGLLVGGGATPEYHASLSPLYPVIRQRVAGGLPYAGFSAGAAIAATTAVIGGWTIDGVPVCPEDAGEELGPVTVVPGIGLVEGAVDVHAAQWGTLTRLVAAVDAHLVDGGVAIDEDTTLVIDGRRRFVTGAGRAWEVRPAAEGVAVTLLRQ